MEWTSSTAELGTADEGGPHSRDKVFFYNSWCFLPSSVVLRQMLGSKDAISSQTTPPVTRLYR